MRGPGADLDQGPCLPIQVGKRQGGWREFANHHCIDSGERGQEKSKPEWYLMSDSRGWQDFNREDGLLEAKKSQNGARSQMWVPKCASR